MDHTPGGEGGCGGRGGLAGGANWARTPAEAKAIRCRIEREAGGIEELPSTAADVARSAEATECPRHKKQAQRGAHALRQ